MISVNDAIKEASLVPTWTTAEERICMAKLAQEVKTNGLIVEVGALYGGMTAILGLSNPDASIVSIDDFSWTPEGYPEASEQRYYDGLKSVGVSNAHAVVGDSMIIGVTWKQNIDLLWIDGGHSYEFVKSDLDKFGIYANVIALHDFGNPFWTTIEKAVTDFLDENKKFYLAEVIETVAVLRRH